jgi:hypothetical protein
LVRIVYVKASHDALFAQNRSRKGAVPEVAIERMMDRWEVPDKTEAHQVEHGGSIECIWTYLMKGKEGA